MAIILFPDPCILKCFSFLLAKRLHLLVFIHRLEIILFSVISNSYIQLNAFTFSYLGALVYQTQRLCHLFSCSL